MYQVDWWIKHIQGSGKEGHQPCEQTALSISSPSLRPRDQRTLEGEVCSAGAGVAAGAGFVVTQAGEEAGISSATKHNPAEVRIQGGAEGAEVLSHRFLGGADGVSRFRVVVPEEAEPGAGSQVAQEALGIPSRADGTIGGVPVGGVAGPAEELEGGSRSRARGRRASTPFAPQGFEVDEVLGMHGVGPKRHPEEVAVPAGGGPAAPQGGFHVGGPAAEGVGREGAPRTKPAEERGHEELEEGAAQGHGTGNPTDFAAPLDELGGQVGVRRLARTPEAVSHAEQSGGSGDRAEESSFAAQRPAVPRGKSEALPLCGVHSETEDAVRVRRMFCSSHERGDRVPALGPETTVIQINGQTNPWVGPGHGQRPNRHNGVEQGRGGRAALQEASLDPDRGRVDTPTGDEPAGLTRVKETQDLC